MYEHSFTIEDVAWLLSIRRLDDGTRQDFPVECPFCGDTRGKCSFCISKNGEQKNVYHCFHCDASGNMLSLYADLMGFYGADRYKEAYQDILRRLERKRTCFPKMKASTFLKPKEKLQAPEYLDYVYRNMLALLELKEVLDNAKGVVEHFFGYITGNLTNVTFNVYAAEAIRAADGVSKDYYAKDELVGTISTDGTGVAQLDNLPLGKYYIV